MYLEHFLYKNVSKVYDARYKCLQIVHSSEYL